MNIVVLDDEPKIRKGLEKLISESFGHKHSVYGFEDSLAALEFLKNNRVDLVITDIKMPNLSGLQLIEAIRKLEQPVEIAILSGYSDFAIAQQAINFKVSRYFTKPTDPDELLAFIEELDRSRDNKVGTSGGYQGKNLMILKCLDYIARNYHTKFNLNDMAAELYITPTYLSQLFKKETGENLSDYVVSFRMAKAKEYLGKLKYSIAEVAGMVGYQDSGYFSNTFRKIYGMTPHEFRNQSQRAKPTGE